MQNIVILAGFLASLIISMIAIPSIVKVAIGKGLYGIDRNKEGKDRKVPTLGGLAIFARVMVSLNFFSDGDVLPELLYINAAAIGLFFIGLKDDILVTAPWWKLVGQVLAALVICIPGRLLIQDPGSIIGLPPGGTAVEVIITVLVIITLMNGYNLIDGIDGLAAGIGILVSLILGIVFWRKGLYSWTLMSAAITGSLAGFTWYNVFSRRRKIYMRDTGSLFLGFLLSIMAVKTINSINPQGLISQIQAPLSFVVSVFFIPLFDIIRIIIVRIFQGHSPMRADRLHIHYRLVDMGLTHLQSTAILLCINLVMILIIAVFQGLGEIALLGLLILTAIILSFLTSLAWKRFRNQQN